MRIRRVILENIRSHVKNEVDLIDGFNCIVGGVGSGKSSILYAIHFGLLGKRLGRSYEYLLREGTDRALVSIEFDQDGKTYTITRGLKKEKGRISHDTSQLAFYEGDRLIASGKTSAVAEQVKATVGFDENLFENVIWVQQEKLKEILNVEPARRQEILDKLFGIADFIEAWERLHAFEKGYEGEKSVYEKDPEILGIDKLRKDFESAYGSFVELQLIVEKLLSDLEKYEESYKKAEEELRKLEDLRKRTEELERDRSAIKATLEEVEEDLRRIKEEIDKKNEEMRRLSDELFNMDEEIKKGYDRLIDAGLPVKTLEEAESLKRSLDEKIVLLMTDKEALKIDLQRIEQSRLTLESESKCPLCRQPLAEDYREKLICQLKQEEGMKRNLLKDSESSLEKLSSQRDLLEEVSEEARKIYLRKEPMERGLNEKMMELERLDSQLKERKKSKDQLSERLAEIGEEIAKFDVEKLKEASVRRDEIRDQLTRARIELELKKEECKRQNEKAEELRERIKSVEEKIKRKEKVEKTLELIRALRDLYKSVGPKLRSDIVKALSYSTQEILDDVTRGLEKSYTVDIDDTYTPRLQETGYWRDVSFLSGGERTILALAYKVGLGQLIMSAKGRSLDLLIFDEPTESLGPEDKSVERLAEAISNIRGVGQIICVTHSEDFARKADYIIRVSKRADESIISYE